MTVNKKSIGRKAAAVFFLFFVFVLQAFPVFAKEVKILFTHDIHSYLDTKTGTVEGRTREYGNAARLSTLLKENRDENTIYLDGGDLAMGTLYQAGFADTAAELRVLGKLGCDVTTFGNHEWDYGCAGVTQELKTAMASGDPLPKIAESSFDFSGFATEEQKELKKALEDYGVCNYCILEKNGLKIAVFALEGPDSIECVQADVPFDLYIDAAMRTLEEIRDQADVVVCLSHTGTSGDGESGDDFDLIEAVPGIDVVISAHSHTIYHEAIVKNGTILGSCGCYLYYLGEMVLDVTEQGVGLKSYRLIPIDGTVAEDREIRAFIDGCGQEIREKYLGQWAEGRSAREVIARSPFDFISLEDMYAENGEYNTGSLIADAYLYEARRNGIEDIDVALVGLGTIRGSIREGEIQLSDAFEICSLGVGSDGSAGHPLLGAYVTGKELKLLTELDASLGAFVSSIRMSYAGLSYTYNDRRMLLDRVTDVYLVRPDGSREEIEDSRLYKCAVNMYAANMLGMLNGLTNGILSITPKNALGEPVTDFYSLTMKDRNGKEIKEWTAFAGYLGSFDKEKDVPVIPAVYNEPLGRKTKISQGGLAVLKSPGTATYVAAALLLLALLIFFLLCRAAAGIVGRIRRHRQEQDEIKDKNKDKNTDRNTDTNGF